jgi:hypothetical protein
MKKGSHEYWKAKQARARHHSFRENLENVASYTAKGGASPKATANDQELGVIFLRENYPCRHLTSCGSC